MAAGGAAGVVRRGPPSHSHPQGNGSICRNGYGNGRGRPPPGATPRSANTTHYATHYGTRYGTRYGSRYEKTAPATWPDFASRASHGHGTGCFLRCAGDPATPPGPAANPACTRTGRTPGERTLPRPGTATDHTPSHTHRACRLPPTAVVICRFVGRRTTQGAHVRPDSLPCPPRRRRPSVRALPRRRHRLGEPPGGRSHPAHTAPPATTPAKVRWQFLSACAPPKPSPRAGRPPRARHLKAQLEPQMPLK